MKMELFTLSYPATEMIGFKSTIKNTLIPKEEALIINEFEHTKKEKLRIYTPNLRAIE